MGDFWMNKQLLVSISAIMLCVIFLAGTASAEGGNVPILMVKEFPQIEIYPNEEIEFEVTLANSGTKYADAKLWFRDLPDGLEIIDSGGSKLVDMGKSAVYTVKMKANTTVRVGTYFSQISGDSKDAQRNWYTFTIKVISATPTPTPARELMQQTKSVAGFEAIMALTGLFVIDILRRKKC